MQKQLAVHKPTACDLDFYTTDIKQAYFSLVTPVMSLLSYAHQNRLSLPFDSKIQIKACPCDCNSLGVLKKC